MEQAQVHGRGFAEHEVPAQIALARLLSAVLNAAALALFGLWALGWDWLASGFTTKVALAAAALATLCFALLLGFLRSHALMRIWNLRRLDGKTVYGGDAGAVGACIFLAFPLAACFFAGQRLYSSFPVPNVLRRASMRAAAPKSPLKPVFLWDYATAYDPSWFRDIEIVLPYEKGPPQKLLGSFFLQNRGTRSLVAAFHGKRPRQYDPAQVGRLFPGHARTKRWPPPRDWPLLLALSKEAGTGLSSAGRELYLFENHIASGQGAESVTPSIGVPGRLFLWGPDGGVFQVRCDVPCGVQALLDFARFPADPSANLKERRDLTKLQLRSLLDKNPQDPAERRRYEAELAFLLLSWLTLDPRDPEAFFHIGKLASNRETAASALRYGKDLGMSGAQIAELEANLSRFAY